MPAQRPIPTVRRRRPRRAAWHWHVSYQYAGSTPGDEPHPDRPTAEEFARVVAHLGARDVELFHVDSAGWRTPYPLATTAAQEITT